MSDGSASAIFTPASTASSARPPLPRMVHASAFDFTLGDQVEMTMGLPFTIGAGPSPLALFKISANELKNEVCKNLRRYIMSYELWVMGYGLWVMSYAPHVSGFTFHVSLFTFDLP